MNILLVEDSKIDAHLFAYCIGNVAPETQLKVINDGQEALDYLNEQKLGETTPDLIILDIGIPNVNGLELLVEIKSESYYEDVPVIVLSGNKSETIQQIGRSLNATDFWEKPITREKVTELIQKWPTTSSSSPTAIS